MLPSWEFRDEDIIRAPAQGTRSVLTAAHSTLGEGWLISQAASPVSTLKLATPQDSEHLWIERQLGGAGDYGAEITVPVA